MARDDWSTDDSPRGPWSEAWRPALRLAVTYLVTAAAWIAVSDWVVKQITDDPVRLSQLQTLKGMGFVLVTSGLLLVLASTRLSHVARSRQALARSRRVLHTLLGNLPGMAYRCLHDERWTALVVSEGAKELTGYEAAMFRDGRRSLKDLICVADEPEVRREIDEAVRQRRPFRLEYRIQRADGAVRWVCEQGRPIFDETGALEALEGFLTDIHERKQAAQLEHERHQLVATREAMERELGVIGHEIRTPLASLRAVAELLLTERNVQLDEQEQLLRAIHDETLRMTDLANNMLEASRLRQNGMASQWTAVSVGELCQSAVAVIRPLTDPARTCLTVDVQPDELTMQGDFSSLRRLLINLLSNAVRHTRKGYIHIHARTETEAGHRYVRLTVKDTGAGIEPARAKLLGIAFALHHGREDSSGAGLGLTICRDIVHAHGGSISFQSETGKGTSFHIRLRADLDSPYEDMAARAIEVESVVI